MADYTDSPDDIYLIPDDLTPYNPMAAVAASAVYTWTAPSGAAAATASRGSSTPKAVLGLIRPPPALANAKELENARDIALLTERVIKSGIFKSFTRTNNGPALRVMNPGTGKVEIVYLRGITHFLRETYFPNSRYYNNPSSVNQIAGTLRKFHFFDEESGEMIEEEVFSMASQQKPASSSQIGHFELGTTSGDGNPGEGIWYLSGEGGMTLHEKTSLVRTNTGAAESMERGRQTHLILDEYQKSYMQELKRRTPFAQMPAILERAVNEFIQKHDLDIQNIEIATKVINVLKLPDLQIIPICSELPVFTASRLSAYLKRRGQRSENKEKGEAGGQEGTGRGRRGRGRGGYARKFDEAVEDSRDVMYGTPLDMFGYSIALGYFVAVEYKTTKGDHLKGTAPMKRPFSYMLDSFHNGTLLQTDVETEMFEQTYMKGLIDVGLPSELGSLSIFANPVGTHPAEYTLQTPAERKAVINKLKRSPESFLVK